MEIAYRALVAAVCLGGGLAVGILGLSLLEPHERTQTEVAVKPPRGGVIRQRTSATASNAIALRTLELANARKRVLKLQRQLDAQTEALNEARRELQSLRAQYEQRMAERNESLSWLLSLVDEIPAAVQPVSTDSASGGSSESELAVQQWQYLLEIDGLRSELELMRTELADSNFARQLERLESASAREQVEDSAAELFLRVGAEAVTALTDALEHPDPEVRRLAAKSLRVFGNSAQSAIPALTMALADPDDRVREEAGLALRTLSD